MNEINTIIKQFLSDYSWLVSFISACIAIIMNYSIKKREDERKNDYKKSMENFKSDLNKKEKVFNSSLAALSNKNEAYYQKKADAIKELWSVILKIRDFSSPMSSVYGILVPEEYLAFVFSEKFDTSLINEKTVGTLIIETDKIASEIKPFIDAELWAKFSLYQSFMLRNLFLFTRGITNKEFEPWYKDDHLVTLCDQLLGKYKKDDYTQIGSFIKVLNTMEELLVMEMREVLSGSKLSNDIIKKSLEIAKLSKY